MGVLFGIIWFVAIGYVIKSFGVMKLLLHWAFLGIISFALYCLFKCNSMNGFHLAAFASFIVIPIEMNLLETWITDEFDLDLSSMGFWTKVFWFVIAYIFNYIIGVAPVGALLTTGLTGY